MTEELDNKPIMRVCDCGCGRTFRLTPQAPHKRFWSENCRNDFHTRELRAMREEVRARRQQK
jgi:hypothetical protein